MSNEEITKLLSVLNMPEANQWKFLGEANLVSIITAGRYEQILRTEGSRQAKTMKRQILADLAFRMRDEAEKDYLGLAIFDVFGHLKPNWYAYKEIFDWLLHEAQPIHWILAALIAKQLAKDK